MTKIEYVDENDNVLGISETVDSRPEGTFFRVSALWLTNSKGEILVAKRSATKRINPNQWGVSVAGTVEFDETYEENIIKESEEEIGIKLENFTKEKKYKISESHFTQFFKATMDIAVEDFKLNDEVAEVKWISKDELKEDIKNNPEKYLTRMIFYVDEL